MRKKHLLPALLVLIAVPLLFAQTNQEGSGSPPAWLTAHFEYMTAGTGRWIADNSRFKSTDEPFDAYGTEWTWGVGKKSIRGRLFALKDQKEAAVFWEFRIFWHPGKQKAIIQQFSGSGIYAVGEMRVIETGEDSVNITEQSFYVPNGTGFQEMHRLIERPGEHETRSFRLEKGSWKPQRTYIWKKVSG